MHPADSPDVRAGHQQGGHRSSPAVDGPVVPAFGRGCLTDLLVAGLEAGPSVELPVEFTPGAPRVLLVLDGLGWEQLLERSSLAPTLSAMAGGPITSVAPSTTASALTSITTGLTPGEHGIVGYRMMIDGEVLNTLRWGTNDRHDCRSTMPPPLLQPYEPFLGQRVPFVSKAEFRSSGFSAAHLRGGELHGYRTPAVMVSQISQLLAAGAPFVYAYWDGVDKVAHEYGLGVEYDAEVAFADRLVADVIAAVPSGTEVVVTADHGQVDCGDRLLPIDPGVMELVEDLSGEARFRWLHAEPGAADDLLDAALAAHGHHAWVRSIDEVLDDAWFGSSVRSEVRRRLGDVALLPFEPIGLDDPADGGIFPLVGRHGSLTSAEMLVPLVGATA